ncbi:lipase [Nocardioides currus]|uniref:Lipase n=1 Tax=Nocardioides currus TaxID=2133958 RepID=A0A2R7Z1V5_9ACTN|nr:lipase [Nocardioides currus]
MSPARRRFAVGATATVVVAVLAVVGTVLLRRDPAVRPVAQDRPGPVLLVPGFGGSTSALEVLADALQGAGREVRIVGAGGSGTGDLHEQAVDLGRAVDAALEESGASSVDVVGYSAGGVVLRIYVADLGGGSTVRRAVTLASPHHGTDLAALASSLGTRACPMACQQLDPDSDLLRALNAGTEAPSGPAWVALWTDDDATVVPPDSGDLEGALGFSVQSICPDLTVAHADVPRTPAVIAMVRSVLGTGPVVEPDDSACVSR